MTALIYTSRNRTHLLRNSLARLRDLTLPDEIIVVDDGGDDDCETLCLEPFPAPIRYIRTDNFGDTQCSHARNVAIKSTDADIVITSEPEMLFDTDVVAQLFTHSADHPTEVISAGTVHHLNPDGGLQDTTVGWVAPFIALYRREWLLAVGGWDESFPDSWGHEDTDLLTRLRWTGVGQYRALDIVATHQWHPSRVCDQARNDAHRRGKVEGRDTIANLDREWGIPL